MSINYQNKLSRLSTSLADVITCLHPRTRQENQIKIEYEQVAWFSKHLK